MEGEIVKKLKVLGKLEKVQKNAWWVDADMKHFDRLFNTLRMMGVEYISTISGTEEKGVISVVYHCELHGKTLNVRFRIPAKDPKIPTITGVFPGVELYERELAEMLGVEVTGHPDPRPLFLADASPKTPLRRHTI